MFDIESLRRDTERDRHREELEIQLLLEKTLMKRRQEIGEIKTSLTYEIGAAQGVQAYSVKEIMYVYGVNRATAYRWKKFDCHPSLMPRLDSKSKLRWTALPEEAKPVRKCKNRVREPYSPILDTLKAVRSAIRHGCNKLNTYPRSIPYPPSCVRVMNEIDEAVDELYDIVESSL